MRKFSHSHRNAIEKEARNDSSQETDARNASAHSTHQLEMPQAFENSLLYFSTWRHTTPSNGCDASLGFFLSYFFFRWNSYLCKCNTAHQLKPKPRARYTQPWLTVCSRLRTSPRTDAARTVSHCNSIVAGTTTTATTHLRNDRSAQLSPLGFTDVRREACRAREIADLADFQRK